MCQYCHLYSAIGKPCEVCGLQAQPSAPVAVSKPAKVAAPQTRAKTPNWDTTSVKPRIRKGDGSLQSKPKTVAPLAVVQKPLPKVNVAPILATLKAEGMDTDSKIAEGLRTGRVMQAISWQVNYGHVVDYLISKGYDVDKYRYRIVCGSEAA